MIREDLLEFKYYLDRLSMFMKQSYGINEHIEIFYQQLYQVNKCYDELIATLQIFNRNPDDEILSDTLDNLGNIFGCYRKFTINYIDSNNNPVYKEINLEDDNDFLVYIKCQIIKQNFDGTFGQLQTLYSTENQNGLVPLKLTYVISRANSLDCDIYFDNNGNFSQDIKDLFLAGYLSIESMGIKYTRHLENTGGIAMFALDDIASNAPDYYKFSDDNNPKGGKFI